jgi:hypothetical protein
MSAEMIAQIDLLLTKGWTPEEKDLIKKVYDNLIFYKTMIPKNLKKDITLLLQMANDIKSDYDLIKLKMEALEIENKHLTEQILIKVNDDENKEEKEEKENEDVI